MSLSLLSGACRSRSRVLLLLLLVLLALSACGGTPLIPAVATKSAAAVPTSAPIPATWTIAPQVIPSETAEIPTITPEPQSTATFTYEPEPTSTPGPAFTATGIPTESPVILPTARPPATSTPRLFTRVKIFLIAFEDNGRSGPLVGCGDSAIPVERNIAPTAAPLTAALNELLSLRDQFYGQSGLYNALHQSNLQVVKVTIENGVAIIHLTGNLQLGGECDDPRVEAQLTLTALQFSTVRAVQIFLDGVPLKDRLGGRGTP